VKDNFVAAKSASLQVVEYATKLGCLSFKIELTNLSLSIKVYFVGYLFKRYGLRGILIANIKIENSK